MFYLQNVEEQRSWLYDAYYRKERYVMYPVTPNDVACKFMLSLV